MLMWVLNMGFAASNAGTPVNTGNNVVWNRHRHKFIQQA